MISLEALVTIVIYLLIAAAVIGLLYFLIVYCERNLGGPPLLYAVIRVVFVVLIVLFCIGLLLSLLSGRPLFRT